MTLVDRVAALFVKVFSIDPEDFSLNAVPEDILRWDSLGHMTLVMELEEQFKVHFEVDEIMEMSSAAKIIEILTSKGVKDSS